jgi:hypothetical protein
MKRSIEALVMMEMVAMLAAATPVAHAVSPKRAMHGVFDFKDWTTGQTATATADAKVRCTKGLTV